MPRRPIQVVEDGLPRTRKVDCQVCGQVKELGQRCEGCAFPLVSIPDFTGRPLIFLPLVPSSNNRLKPGYRGRPTLTDDARDYLESVSKELGRMLRELEVGPLSYYTQVEVWVVLSHGLQDAVNVDKILWDTCQRAGFVVNDRFIIPVFRGVYYDAKNAGVIVRAMS